MKWIKIAVKIICRTKFIGILYERKKKKREKECKIGRKNNEISVERRVVKYKYKKEGRVTITEQSKLAHVTWD